MVERCETKVSEGHTSMVHGVL